MRNKQILVFFFFPLDLYLQRSSPLHKIGIDLFQLNIFRIASDRIAMFCLQLDDLLGF